MRALDEVDLELERGTFTVVLGTNGSGKSSLLNAIAGSLALTRGQVHLDGREVTRWPEQRRARLISRVFQNPFTGTASDLSVAENLVARGRTRRPALAPPGAGRERRRALRRIRWPASGMGLEDRLDTPIGLLSGGQRQALTVLMATMVRPTLLLLDEHTAALDPRSAEQVIRLTREAIAAGELTTLMVTHSLSQAVQLGDRVLVMHRGQSRVRSGRSATAAARGGRPAAALRSAAVGRPAGRVGGRDAAARVRLSGELDPGAHWPRPCPGTRSSASSGMAAWRRSFSPGTEQQQKPVAVKIMHPGLASALDAERFRREMAIAGSLDHPLIVPLYDSGTAGDIPFYVMPYVEGESLFARLERERRLALDDALRITHDVAAALGYAHGRGVLHRDVKPENILLAGGRALVADFGLARAIGAADYKKLTETGVVVGTAYYMSPEQLREDRDLDQRTDVYSLGCTLVRDADRGPSIRRTDAHRDGHPDPSCAGSPDSRDPDLPRNGHRQGARQVGSRTLRRHGGIRRGASVTGLSGRRSADFVVPPMRRHGRFCGGS